MAEMALAPNNDWQAQQSIGDSLRQKKQAQLNNAQMLKEQGLGGNTRINDRLLSRQTNQPDEQPSDETASQEGQANEADISDSLKQARQLSKQLDNTDKVAEGADKLIQSATQLATGQLLSLSWKTLIESWGLTLIYLNLHAWAGFIEGHKVFCKLGSEVKAPGIFKAALGFMEAVAILLMDLLVILTILTVISLLALLVDAMVHPVQNFKILWDLFGGQLDILRPQ